MPSSPRSAIIVVLTTLWLVMFSITMPSSPRSAIIVLLTTLWLVMFSLNSTAQSDELHHFCPNNTQIRTTPNTTYFSNLDLLLSSLSQSTAQSNGFHTATVSGLYGLYLCRGDTTTDVCGDCVATAVRNIRTLCPNTTKAIIWYDQCLLRYSNAPFFGTVEANITFLLFNIQNNSQPDEPDIDGRALMYSLAAEVPTLPLMYETKESNKTELRYSMAQCSRDLGVANCSYCLKQLTELSVGRYEGKFGWRFFNPSCFVRYERYPFYTIPNTTTPIRPPSNHDTSFYIMSNTAVRPPSNLGFPYNPHVSPPLNVSIPYNHVSPQPNPRSPYNVHPPPKPGNRSSLKQTIIISVAVAFVVVVLLIGSIYYHMRRRKSHADDSTAGFDAMNQEAASHGLQHRTINDFAHSYISMERSEGSGFPLIPLTTILLATNNFSEKHKLGQGGFGPVYKGDLPDGKQIAVKRLSSNSGQGLEEFKNEVIFIAKLQHKNLVRLLGCCMEQNEKLLVYEYMSNASLDVHIFDPKRRAQLDWKRRLGIIYGISKGLCYLHEDSRLKIIHRDLKASNILLDSELNPKISNFGLARSFLEDQIDANTRRVMGTYGYMAPEYAMEGLFSVKSDVFSFGVLLLEIISGRRNNGFYLSEHGQSLLVYAWRRWCEGQALVLMDSTLMESCVTSEVLKCIHIGLLCVQEDAADRPTMSRVIVMLSSDTVTLPLPMQPASLPLPMQPAFSVGRMTQVDKVTSSSGNGDGSINDVTFSSVVPR